MNQLDKIIFSFLHAVRFLTLIPVGKEDQEKFQPLFFLASLPMIGALIGFLLLLVIYLLFFVPAPILGFIVVVFYLGLTQMLHLDGFADTLEGFIAGKNKEDTVRIMKDSHLGVFGVVSLVILILGYWQTFTFLIGRSSVNPNTLPSIVVALTVSRWSLLLLATDAKSAQPQGLGAWFIQLQSKKALWISGILPFIFLIGLFHFSVLPVIVFLLLAVWLIRKWADKKIQGISGDVLGFSLEITQLLILISACVYFS